MTYRYTIEGKYYDEAYEYALKSKSYTSNRHDFHEGGLDAKQRKMFEGKLGEKGFKMFLDEKNITYREDNSPHTDRDFYDFIVNDLKIDVKTRTEDFHIRTLEMVEQVNNFPKHIYISTRLYRESNTVELLGWFGIKDLFRKNKVENNGYLDNYVMYDDDLRDIDSLLEYLEM